MAPLLQATHLYFDRTLAHNFSDLVRMYGLTEFASPLRSTVPLLALVQCKSDALQQLIHISGFSARPSFHFEFTVLPARGKGRPSYTDIMLCSGMSALSIEAKWTEPAYPTVGEWLRIDRGGDRNRENVLQGWLNILQRYSNRSLVSEDFTNVTYQMVHRAASACATAVDKPHLAYLHFKVRGIASGANSEYYERGLRDLHAIMGYPVQFPFYLGEIEMNPTANFRAIEGLPKGSIETAVVVRTALKDSELFEFTNHNILKIGI